jgi:anti-sigma regulatory factor (Ser/Thr protein kinase)
MSSDRTEGSWRIPNQLGPAYAIVYEILAWIDALPIREEAKYATYAALEELISNKIKYGYTDTDERFIVVQITAGETVICLDLVDDGTEFDLTAQPSPDIVRNLDEGVAGGLGIELVRRICTRMDYRREGALNRITLHIDIREEPEAGGAMPDGSVTPTL